MITVDCSELSTDERLALASSISDKMQGRALALQKGHEIVLDDLSDQIVQLADVVPIVKEFLSRRKDGKSYSFEAADETIVVHSPDPIAAQHGGSGNQLPPNLMNCPFCSFVTPYEELYVVHYRSHGFV